MFEMKVTVKLIKGQLLPVTNKGEIIGVLKPERELKEGDKVDPKKDVIHIKPTW